MVDENKIKNLDEIFSVAIEKSNAHIEKKILLPYDIKIDEKNPFNPVEKALHIYLLGCPPEIMHSASGIYALTESSADFHITPETNPNFMSFRICTCGNNTHPILALRNVLEKLNPSAGKICYYKEGYDISKRKSGFPKTVEGIIKKYYEQFDLAKYRFEAQEVKQFEYDFYLYNPARLTQKMASILGVEWPLNDETKKLGIYIDDKEFQKNGNGNGNGEKK